MLSPKLAAVLGAIRRHWVLVLVTAVIAGVVAGIASAAGPQMYTGTAVIDIETTVFTRLTSLTGTERVLRELQTPEYYEAVAEETGSIDAATVQQGLSSYTVGTPAYELRVAFTTSDEELAEPVARAAGEVALEVADGFNAVERERHQAIVDEADQAIEALYVEPVDTAWERADIAAKQFGFELNKSNSVYVLDLIDSAYTLRDTFPVSEATRQQGVVEYAIGGAMLGLALGIVLALLRDRGGAKV